MNILIANPGSTSYKCKLFDSETWQILFQATVERIGDTRGFYSCKIDDNIQTNEQAIPDYQTAIDLTLQTLEDMISLDEIAAIGFKVVLAKDVTGCVEIDTRVIQAMDACLPLAPVHNQVYIDTIKIFQKMLPQKPLIGLFETAFHTQIPEKAAIYGIPNSWIKKHGIRKYGFHGASHRYISERAKALFHADKVISCHLGGSSSVCAIKNGVSADTSMGMSPQCGLPNANRVGDLDPFALLYIMEQEKLSIEETRKILINKSGLHGISGLSGDFRDIKKAMIAGNEKAKLTFEVLAYNIKRFIGEYLAILNGTDLIAFTGGLGQNASHLRAAALENMENLGIELDEEKNKQNPTESLISTNDSHVKIAILPANEELIVARSVAEHMTTNAIPPN